MTGGTASHKTVVSGPEMGGEILKQSIFKQIEKLERKEIQQAFMQTTCQDSIPELSVEEYLRKEIRSCVSSSIWDVRCECHCLVHCFCLQYSHFFHLFFSYHKFIYLFINLSATKLFHYSSANNITSIFLILTLRNLLLGQSGKKKLSGNEIQCTTPAYALSCSSKDRGIAKK